MTVPPSPEEQVRQALILFDRVAAFHRLAEDGEVELIDFLATQMSRESILATLCTALVCVDPALLAKRREIIRREGIEVFQTEQRPD